MNSIKSYLFKTILTLTLLNLCHCASITDRKQFVRVIPSSNTDSISINKKEVGKGISTIQINRQKKPLIQFGKQKPQALKTKYRWGHSFGGNALTFVYAPIGWATDFITGAAWRAVHMKLDEAKDSINKDSRILVLPPYSAENFATDLLISKIESWASETFPEAKILDSRSLQEKIEGLGFNYDYEYKTDDPDEFNELLFETKATHLVISKYDHEKKEVLLKVYNPYSTRNIQEKTLTDISIERIKNQSWLLKESFNFIPNTISLGAISTSYGSCPTPKEREAYCQQPKKANILSALSLISFNNVLHYRKRKSWRVYLRFFPDFTASVNHIELKPNTSNLPEVNAEIDWHFLSFGYGPRLSWAIPVGELFFDLMPFGAANYYRWKRDDLKKTRWTTNWGLSVQMGFNTWVARRWNLQIFAKSQFQTVEIPKEFFGAVENQNSSMTITRGGIALGYYFFEEKKKASKWLGLKK